MNWIEGLHWLHERDKSLVMITVAGVDGSAPRETQAKMVVWEEGEFDTIGGGALEHQAMGYARELLRDNRPGLWRRNYTLGPDLSQCCGGRVELVFECIPGDDFNVVVLGAGHVGEALVSILRGLRCRVLWLDNRQQRVDALLNEQAFPARVRLRRMGDPEPEIENCPANAWYLVMTHSHELDLQLVEAILSRTDAAFCGLIGSRSKAAKFRARLKRKSFSEPEIARLTCPVGLAGVPGKKPMEVAVSIAAQLLNLRGAAARQPARVLESVPAGQPERA